GDSTGGAEVAAQGVIDATEGAHGGSGPTKVPSPSGTPRVGLLVGIGLIVAAFGGLLAWGTEGAPPPRRSPRRSLPLHLSPGRLARGRGGTASSVAREVPPAAAGSPPGGGLPVGAVPRGAGWGGR